MVKILSITKAREQLATLVKRAGKNLDDYIITVNGEPVAVLLNHDEYESWKETEEILSDPKALDEIKKAEKEIKNGKWEDWEDVKKELGIDV
jgi:antitoxin YefM